MASIIDPTPDEAGNPSRALESASDVATGAKVEGAGAETQYKIPDKFVGKTLEEVLTAYQNLETAYGRAKNDLGQTRQSVDQLLQQKRDNDLRANGAPTSQRQVVKEPELTAADLLENPKQALNSYLEHRESATTKDLRERLAFQEAQMAQQSFLGKHPDWQEHTNDPAFIEWAKQTPYRTSLATQAAGNNLQAADALLSEYKVYKPLLASTTAKDKNLAAASRVGLERSSAAGDGVRPAGKIMRRIDAQALRISDPEKYDSPAFQNELLKAIAEDRYK